MLIGCAVTSCTTIETTDGMAVAGIRLGRSSASDVKRRFGQPDSVKQYGDYSTEMLYGQKGLTFYYLTNDKRKSIFGITVTAPYKLRTVAGIVLNSSTMNDVRNAYGDLNWQTTDGSDYWFSEHNGIEYGILREKSVPQYPLNERRHISRTIVRIELDNRYQTQQIADGNRP